MLIPIYIPIYSSLTTRFLGLPSRADPNFLGTTDGVLKDPALDPAVEHPFSHSGQPHNEQDVEAENFEFLLQDSSDHRGSIES